MWSNQEDGWMEESGEYSLHLPARVTCSPSHSWESWYALWKKRERERAKERKREQYVRRETLALANAASLVIKQALFTLTRHSTALLPAILQPPCLLTLSTPLYTHPPPLLCASRLLPLVL
jgi:hypothetical protein